MLGAPASDWLGPRYALALGVFLQAVVGFISKQLLVQFSNPFGNKNLPTMAWG